MHGLFTYGGAHTCRERDGGRGGGPSDVELCMTLSLFLSILTTCYSKNTRSQMRLKGLNWLNV